MHFNLLSSLQCGGVARLRSQRLAAAGPLEEQHHSRLTRDSNIPELGNIPQLIVGSLI